MSRRRIEVFYPEAEGKMGLDAKPENGVVAYLDKETDTGELFLSVEQMPLTLDTMSDLRDILNDVRNKLLLDKHIATKPKELE